MKTRILELTVFINGKKMDILNTQSEIIVDWEVDIKPVNESSIRLSFVFNSISGWFSYITENELYTKACTYKLKAGFDWTYTSVPHASDVISPTSAIINFDEKTVNIKF